MPNPWEMDWGNEAGPVYGPPPAAPKPAGPPAGFRPSGEGLEYIPGGPADPNRPDKPNLPAGYIMGPDGVARRIPGLPPEATQGGEDDVKLQQKRAALTSLETQINRVDELYRKGFKDESLGLLSSLAEYLPTDEAAQLNAAGAGLAEQGLAAFRVPGVGSQSDTELRQFVEANRPSTWDRDTAVEEKLRQLRARVDATRAEMGLPPAQWLGMEQAPEVTGQPPSGETVDRSTNLNELNAPPTENLVRSDNGFQTVDDPNLSGVKGEYLRRLGSGQAPGELLAFLNKAGVKISPSLAKSVADQANFRRQNPNVPIGNYNIEALDDIFVPLTPHESMMNDAAQTPGGAYAMNAGQAASFNTLDELAGATGGNAERANIALEDSRRFNPVASTAGSISGSVMGALAGEAGLARAGMQAGVPRSLLADIAYGTGSGAGGAEEGNRLGGALTGGLAAGAGSVGGQLVAKGIGSTISPTGGRLSDLYAAGVRPTPGQRMLAAGDGKGLSGLVGRAVNATEEGLSSVPIVGSAIRGARQEARDQFQLGAYNQALEEIGQSLPKGMKTGTAPYAFTKKAFNDAYDKAREGLIVAADDDLTKEVGRLSGEVENLAEPSIRRFETIIKNVVMRRITDTGIGDVIEGPAFKEIQSELGKTIRGIRKSPSGDGELADALSKLQSTLDRAARRHSNPEAVALLDKADAGYAKFVRIRDAAKSRGGEAAEFSPTQFDRSVQRMTGGEHSDAYLRGDALMQDYAQQGMSLVDRMPNSGTPERMMVGAGAAGAAGYLEPTTLSLLGTLGVLYAPGVRKATTGVMAPRGKAAKAVGDAVRKRARIAGAVGSGLALSAQKDDDQ